MKEAESHRIYQLMPKNNDSVLMAVVKYQCSLLITLPGPLSLQDALL